MSCAHGVTMETNNVLIPHHGMPQNPVLPFFVSYKNDNEIYRKPVPANLQEGKRFTVLNVHILFLWYSFAFKLW